MNTEIKRQQLDERIKQMRNKFRWDQIMTLAVVALVFWVIVANNDTAKKMVAEVIGKLQEQIEKNLTQDLSCANGKTYDPSTKTCK